MDRRRVIALTIGLILAALAVVVWVVPTLRRARLAEPVRAHVGIEVGGNGIARVGRVTLAAGEPFRLHAIVEAEATDGSIVFYTEASEVRFTADERRGAAARTRPWSERPEPARVLWLTLEGAAAFRPLAEGETLQRFAFEEFSHPEWGTGWVANGSLEARRDDALELEGLTSGLGFGTQHYQAWVEILDEEGDAFPKERLKSPGSAELLQDPEAATAVEVALPGRLALPSRVFGLTQIEAPAGAAEPLQAALAERYEQGMLFSRALLLRDVLEGAGRTLDTLDWQLLDLGVAEPWGQRVQAGDLLRVGGRWVVLFRDAGVSGVVDGGDLCFEYERGAVVRRVSAVFVELDDPEGGDVEWASLGAVADRSAKASASRGGGVDQVR